MRWTGVGLFDCSDCFNSQLSTLNSQPSTLKLFDCSDCSIVRFGSVGVKSWSWRVVLSISKVATAAVHLHLTTTPNAAFKTPRASNSRGFFTTESTETPVRAAQKRLGKETALHNSTLLCHPPPCERFEHNFDASAQTASDGQESPCRNCSNRSRWAI